MGNCTAAIKKKSPLTPAGKTVIADLSLSGSYATGGDSVPPSIFGLRRISALVLQSGACSPAGHALEVINGADDYTAPKIRVRDVATGSEIANATSLSAQSIRVIAYVMPYR